MLSGRLRRLRDELGVAGLVALGLLAGAVLFLLFVLRPLEARNELLARQLAGVVSPGSATDERLVRAAAPAARLAAFYQFFEAKQETTDRLAELYGIGKAAGVELRSAEYRLQKTGTRIERYEIALPLTGSYAQVRAFLENALIAIPALSLDRVKFHRKRPDDTLVEAEVRLTLYLANP